MRTEIVMSGLAPGVRIYDVSQILLRQSHLQHLVAPEQKGN
jgi:hypothetical protein